MSSPAVKKRKLTQLERGGSASYPRQQWWCKWRQTEHSAPRQPRTTYEITPSWNVQLCYEAAFPELFVVRQVQFQLWPSLLWIEVLVAGRLHN